MSAHGSVKRHGEAIPEQIERALGEMTLVREQRPPIPNVVAALVSALKHPPGETNLKRPEGNA